jgi:hypothetical protein
MDQEFDKIEDDKWRSTQLPPTNRLAKSNNSSAPSRNRVMDYIPG